MPGRGSRPDRLAELHTGLAFRASQLVLEVSWDQPITSRAAWAAHLGVHLRLEAPRLAWDAAAGLFVHTVRPGEAVSLQDLWRKRLPPRKT